MHQKPCSSTGCFTLNPDKWTYEYPRFVEEQVKHLCDTLNLNKQKIHFGFIESQSSGGRSIPSKLNKLCVAVGTLSKSYAYCERGFSSMNNIMGLCVSDLWKCSKVQSAHHMLHGCSKFKPPCHVYEVDNPALLK